MKRSRVRLGAILLGLGMCLPATRIIGRQPEPVPAELAWIGLYNDELVEWLENRNRLDALCGPEGAGQTAAECRAARLAPEVLVIPARAEPRAEATRLGEIVVLARPGTGLMAYASAGGRAEPFTPDLYDSDWGYGPFFHQTVLARRGLWFRVPVPILGSVWVNAGEWSAIRGETGDVQLIRTLHRGDIITTPRGDMVVLGVDGRVLRLRPEQKADMWCEPGNPPALAPWKEIHAPFAELFDAAGHLLIRYKYTRGC